MSFENQKWSENAPEVISEGLKFKIFLGGMPPDPPTECAVIYKCKLVDDVPINHVRCKAAVINNPGSFYSSFCKGYGHCRSLWVKISEELSAETAEKVTKLRSSEPDSHVDSLYCLLIHELIMRFIVRPTNPLFL